MEDAEAPVSRVREFHEAFDLDAPRGPTVPDPDLASLRMRLIREEFEEVKAESDKLLVALRTHQPAAVLVPIMQALVKEICDLRYVSEGSLVAFGVEPDAYSEVHRSNMSKLGEDGKPIRREDGKVLKGPGYQPVEAELMFPSVIEGTNPEEE